MTDYEEVVRLRALNIALTAQRDTLKAAIERLAADWDERARRVRPLESAPITAEKRERTKEWMFYINRANELRGLVVQK